MIELKDVRFCYTPEAQEADICAGKDVIKDINLTIKEGEFVALLGANGSGKTTLGKLLNALILPTKGEILVDGISTLDIDKIWEIRRLVGMVFQDPSRQIVASVVEDELAFGPENLGIAPEVIRSRIDKALTTLNIEHLRGKEPHLLSGGQKQRVAIASVLVMEPKYIVMDEPTAMLDPVGRREIIKTVQLLKDELEIAVIYITHHMEEALKADKIIALERGRVTMQGNPRELFSQVSKLKSMGLDVPPVLELTGRLRDKGIELNPNLLSVKDAGADIISAWKKKS